MTCALQTYEQTCELWLRRFVDKREALELVAHGGAGAERDAGVVPDEEDQEPADEDGWQQQLLRVVQLSHHSKRRTFKGLERPVGGPRDCVRKRAQHERVKVLRRQVGCGGDVWLAGSESAGGQGSEMGAVLALAELSVVVGGAKHGHG